MCADLVLTLPKSSILVKGLAYLDLSSVTHLGKFKSARSPQLTFVERSANYGHFHNHVWWAARLFPWFFDISKSELHGAPLSQRRGWWNLFPSSLELKKKKQFTTATKQLHTNHGTVIGCWSEAPGCLNSHHKCNLRVWIVSRIISIQFHSIWFNTTLSDCLPASPASRLNVRHT